MATFSLEGKTVIVTGAGRGLGQGMALAIVDAGGVVAGIARSEDELDQTAATANTGAGRFFAIPADLRAGGLDHLVARIEEEAGPIHGVVHAAGMQLRKPAVDVSAEEWRDVLALNLDVPFLLSTAIGRRQLARGSGGSHVFVASLGSALGVRDVAPYCAAKSGLLGVMRSLAVEWAAAGIRSNAIAPGYFHTALTADVLAVPERHATILSRIPMGRLGVAADLSGAVVFLLSDASGYITGHTLTVDGGWLAA